MTLISFYCPLCISRCGCFYKVEDGVLTDVLPNPQHPTGKHLENNENNGVRLD